MFYSQPTIDEVHDATEGTAKAPHNSAASRAAGRRKRANSAKVVREPQAIDQADAGGDSPSPEQARHKVCTKCKELKLESEYYVSYAGTEREWVNTRCKLCYAAKGARWYKANRDRVLTRSRAYHATHRDQKKRTSRVWGERNPVLIRQKQERYRAKNKHRISAEYLRRVYGMPVAQYQSMLVSQNNSCAICANVFGITRKDGPQVDHDHTTGVIRGMLCGNCNRGLGCLQDSLRNLQRAGRYLRAARKLTPPTAVLKTHLASLTQPDTNSTINHTRKEQANANH